MSSATWLDEHDREIRAALTKFRLEWPTVQRWGRRLLDTFESGGRLLVAGNGGSAAEAQHLTAELVGRFLLERRPFPAVCLSAETSSLTAIVNDYGAAEMFARQVQAHGGPGDILLLLSTSGRSPNLLSAADRARNLGLQTWAITGPGPNPLTARCDESVTVQAPSTAAIQAIHLIAVHGLCAVVDAAIAESATPPRPRSDSPRGGPAQPPAAPEAHRINLHPVDDGTSPVRHVIVVGDAVLDREITGRTERICPDAPVPVLDVTSVRESPGAAGLTALLARAPGVRVTLIAPVADDAAGAALLSMLAPYVQMIRLGHTGPTRRKTRVRSAGQSLLRIDDGGPGTPTDIPTDEVLAALATADVVLVSDYGAGTTSDPGVRAMLTAAAATTKMVWDPHPRGGPPVEGVTLVTPNLAEALAARQVAQPDGPDLAAQPDLLAKQLRATWAADAACVTAGATGAFLATSDEQTYFLPAAAVPGADPCGAGDRFAASAAVALAGGSLITEAVAIGVEAASDWVAAGGAATWQAPAADDRATIRERPGRLPDSTHRPSAAESLEALASRLRMIGGTLVATGGCFDIVHPGHVATLQAARRLGDHLVVLINSDASVARLKGPGRPVVTAQDRARVLEAFDCVDAVAIFDEDDPRAALSVLRPDVWVKGGDYGSGMLPESGTVESHGGRVVLLPYLSGRSTTSIIERSRAGHQ